MSLFSEYILKRGITRTRLSCKKPLSVTLLPPWLSANKLVLSKVLGWSFLFWTFVFLYLTWTIVNTLRISSSNIPQVYLSLGRRQGRYWRTRVIRKALSPLSWNEQPLYNFLCICLHSLSFFYVGCVPQFFACSSNASLYRCTAECRCIANSC